jgi:single-stranded-DNA-specific exonuclease
LKRNWKLKNLLPENALSNSESLDEFKKEIESIKSNVRLPDLIIQLLYQRGITNYAKVIKFFKSTKEKLYSPFLLRDCEKAADRLVEIIKNKERIMVLGDYDVDGTCGVSMFYLFLKKFGAEPLVYIPDRISEGYGISNKAINLAKEEGIKLIVSIDCGITAAEQIRYANELGVDFIICDHHQPPDELPDAFAVINPLRKDCSYTFKHLCGTGVAFKLIQAVCEKLGETNFPHTLYDFVAIATASDIVSVSDENRILVNEGLELINKNPRPAFRVLIESSNMKIGAMNTTNIVFTIAPRINAVGRLGDAKRAVELLTSEKEEELEELVSILNKENLERRKLDKEITETAYSICEENHFSEKFNVIILHNDSWHPGVVGIVAARLVEKYHLPSIVLTTVNGVAKGSARSINGFNVYEALKKCDNLLVKYGGHYHAAGLEIEVDKIEEFKNALNEIAAEQISAEDKIPEIEIDAELKFSEINNYLLSILQYFEPYGPSNSAPVFLTKNVRIVGDVKTGKVDTHIFKLADDEFENVFDAVFFNSAEYSCYIKNGNRCDVCYSLDWNEWNGHKSIRMKIKAMKFH